MKKKNKILITTGTLLTIGGILIGAYAIDGGLGEKDITPPYGRIEIAGAHIVDDVNYVDRKVITVDIYAIDDNCKPEEIKYYVSAEPISGEQKIDESSWKDYYDGVTERIELPSLTETNTIYAMFKDKAGNTTTIFTGGDTEYTITYDANGGKDAPSAQKTNYGMPLYLTNELPTNEGKYFLGWSTDKNATEAEYNQLDLLDASMFTSSDTNITLYAVWTDKISDLPLLADKVKVGDYVKYPVHYDNVATVNSEYIASLTGWRVLSIEDDGTVNLVSAGVPLTYRHQNNAETSIKKLAINFLDIPFTTSTYYTFIKSGFTPYNVTLEEIFSNRYTATYEEDEIVSYTSTYNDGTIVTYSGEKQAGDLKVRSITKEDLDKVYDKTGETITTQGTNVTNAKYEKMLAIPCSDKTSNYAEYWLASAYGTGYLGCALRRRRVRRLRRRARSAPRSFSKVYGQNYRV